MMRSTISFKAALPTFRHWRTQALQNARPFFHTANNNNVNVFLWNTKIREYAKTEIDRDAEKAIALYSLMVLQGVHPDKYTFPIVLKACATLSAVHEGIQIHNNLIKRGFLNDIYVGNSLTNMYAKCEKLESARQVFDKMPQRDVVSWNAMISGYARNGNNPTEALRVFYQMELQIHFEGEDEGILPDEVSLISVLQACAQLGSLSQGRWIHKCAIQHGLDTDVFVCNSLVTVYAKSGDLYYARQVFDKMPERNVVSWNGMIGGYAQNGLGREALTIFCRMGREGVKMDLFTLASVLPACAQLGCPQVGEWMHGHIVKSGFLSDIVVGTGLIDMYTKCRNVESAYRLFESMPKKNVVSWSAMIAGYVQIGKARETLALFNQMQMVEMKPDAVTMVNVLPACAHLSALQQGKSLHGYIIRSGYESDVFVENSLIDMYAKCGCIEFAGLVFNTMPYRDLVSWNSMIAGYGMHGKGKDAIAYFAKMQESGIRPNHVTFVCVLSACSHSGMVDQGWQYFDCMKREYCITPKLEHYACMVDLLGRAGHLHEAVDFIRNVPLKPGASVWGALLGACRIHCDFKLGQWVAERLFELEPENAGLYVLLSNIYASAGRLDGMAKMRTMMKDKGLKKTPGCSFIEVKNKVHAFLVQDKSHPQSEEIYVMLESLAVKMRAAGYVPNTSLVLQEME